MKLPPSSGRAKKASMASSSQTMPSTVCSPRNETRQTYGMNPLKKTAKSPRHGHKVIQNMEPIQITVSRDVVVPPAVVRQKDQLMQRHSIHELESLRQLSGDFTSKTETGV